MADTYHCILCKKQRDGRFTRVKIAGGGGWDHGHTLPSWYCWICLKPGEGRDETQETMMQKKAEKTMAVASVGKGLSEAMSKSQEVLVLVPNLQTDVGALEVTDVQTYLYADQLLSRVRAAKKVWEPLWTRIMERTIKPIRNGLEELYSLNRDVEKPFTLLETAIKQKMQGYKQEEARRIADAEAAQRREVDRLRRESEEKERKAMMARTPQMRGRLEKAARELQDQAAEVEEQESSPLPVLGAASSTRSVKRWGIKSFPEFVTAVAEGTLDINCLMVNESYMDEEFKKDPEGMQAWPGVTVYDHITIVGRG